MLMLNRPWETYANFVRRFVVLAGVVSLFTGCVFAQTLTTLYTFKGGASDGSGSSAALTMDAAGNLYGTTQYGGSGNGTVFELTKSGNSYTESLLHSFTGGTDGNQPIAGLVMDASGDLYGTTYLGGAGGGFDGVVFHLTKSGTSYAESILHDFTGGADGSRVFAGLAIDAAGNLYGTTENGGNGDNGTVFELMKSGDSYTKIILYEFAGGSSDGRVPDGTLILDAAGNLYGTTLGGGAYNAGTVFELAKSGDSYTETVLYSLTGGSDGGLPEAGLVMDAAGNLYGTTTYGGSASLFSGNGTVFMLAKSSTGYTESTLHTFTGGSDGGFCAVPLIVDAAGNLYGTTQGGGSSPGLSGNGMVFKLTKSGNSYTETVLYTFTGGSDGESPSSLIMDAAGNLYGTTGGGGILNGPAGSGTVFELTVPRPFSSFNAKLQVSKNGFALLGSFSPGAGAPAIDPVTQPVSLTVGSYQVTVPAGSFHKNSVGLYEYGGKINGVALGFVLSPISKNSWGIAAGGAGVNLSTLTNPVTVTLSIGNNTGKIQLKAQH